MTGELCAVLLAAGAGTRLRPLTNLKPKALCPVGNRPLLDRALALVAGVGLTGSAAVAVNASWLGEQIADHLRGHPDPAHQSLEPALALGTAGGVANLRDWIDGRAVLVGNADAYLAGAGIEALLAGWDGETVRLLGVPAAPGADTFSGCQFAGFSLLPWRWVRRLSREPGELVKQVWRPAEAAGALSVIKFAGYFRDAGTVPDYLAANRHAAGGGNLLAPDATVLGRCRESVVGAGARVEGRLTRAVVWPGGYVGPREQLVDAVRVGRDLTVNGPAAADRLEPGADRLGPGADRLGPGADRRGD